MPYDNTINHTKNSENPHCLQGKWKRRLMRLNTLWLRIVQDLPCQSIPVIENLQKASKLFFHGTGLANYRIGFTEFFHKQALDNVYYGKISKQVTAREIVAQGSRPASLRFWIRGNKAAETDFLSTFSRKVNPDWSKERKDRQTEIPEPVHEKKSSFIWRSSLFRKNPHRSDTALFREKIPPLFSFVLPVVMAWWAHRTVCVHEKTAKAGKMRSTLKGLKKKPWPATRYPPGELFFHVIS